MEIVDEDFLIPGMQNARRASLPDTYNCLRFVFSGGLAVFPVALVGVREGRGQQAVVERYSPGDGFLTRAAVVDVKFQQRVLPFRRFTGSLVRLLRIRIAELQVSPTGREP